LLTVRLVCNRLKCAGLCILVNCLRCRVYDLATVFSQRTCSSIAAGAPGVSLRRCSCRTISLYRRSVVPCCWRLLVWLALVLRAVLVVRVRACVVSGVGTPLLEHRKHCLLFHYIRLESSLWAFFESSLYNLGCIVNVSLDVGHLLDFPPVLGHRCRRTWYRVGSSGL
jgi:hypothetical protein